MTMLVFMGTGSALIAALESAYAAIRERHPALPEVVFVTGTGADSRRRQVRLGHFADQRWEGAGGRAPELFVAGEHLADGADATFCTLLHEATHALAASRGVKDTSRGGRWHNRQFVALALELGLAWPRGEPHRSVGYSEVAMTDETRATYAATIEALGQAITHHLRATPPGDSAAPKGRLLKATCPCGRIIRASGRTLDDAPIICGACRGPFTAPD